MNPGTIHRIQTAVRRNDYRLYKQYAQALDDQNRAQYRKITTGPLYEGRRIVREGLSAEDRIVVSGLQRVRPGLVVAPEEKPLEPCPSPRLPAEPAATPSPDVL